MLEMLTSHAIEMTFFNWSKDPERILRASSEPWVHGFEKKTVNPFSNFGMIMILNRILLLANDALPA